MLCSLLVRRISPSFTKLLAWVQQIFFRNLGVACFFYIDDRLNGELFSSEGFWSRPNSRRTPDYSCRSAVVALYIVCKVLVGLGIAKCVLAPATRIQYLGLIEDSAAQVFCIPEDKKVKFHQVWEQVLLRESTVTVKSLPRLTGKCISFSLVFPGAEFYIRETSASIVRASNGYEVKISPALQEEILFWTFLDSSDKVVQWRSEHHVAISFTLDASSFRWAAVIRLPPRNAFRW